MSRKKLIEELGTREDGKFPLFNLEALKKLMRAGNDKMGWYCTGRKTEAEGDNISYCVFAYPLPRNEKEPPCTKDCLFYKKLYNL